MDVIRPRIDERAYLGADKSVPYSTTTTKQTVRYCLRQHRTPTTPQPPKRGNAPYIFCTDGVCWCKYFSFVAMYQFSRTVGVA
ncbi:MAG: hypothetical protein FWG87_02860 [Defluviitaleaceae bacterium]|nr:hypothetical protein [Defluviitaleaceae bacterium]